jgi:hypothetical protein
VINLITMAAAGLLAACIVYAANHMSGRRLPKWSMPAAIGAAMIAVSIYGEYAWFGDEVAKLPATSEVVLNVQSSAPWRPWTYLAPITNRFIAMDRATRVRSEENPNLVAAEVTLVQRYTASYRVPLAFDCANFLRVDLIEGAVLMPDGTLTGADWVPLDREDKLLRAACNGG